MEKGLGDFLLIEIIKLLIKIRKGEEYIFELIFIPISILFIQILKNGSDNQKKIFKNLAYLNIFFLAIRLNQNSQKNFNMLYIIDYFSLFVTVSHQLRK
jgi:hypothetical protein